MPMLPIRYAAFLAARWSEILARASRVISCYRLNRILGVQESRWVGGGKSPKLQATGKNSAPNISTRTPKIASGGCFNFSRIQKKPLNSLRYSATMQEIRTAASARR